MLTLNDTHTYMRLNTSGFIELVAQEARSSILWSAPESLCDFDSYCGPNGLCTRSASCICPAGFDYLSANPGLYFGCSRKVPMNCDRGSSTRLQAAFYSTESIYRFPQNSWFSDAGSMEECETSCIMDCTCTAFAYNVTCLLWFGELRNTVVLDPGLNGNRLYICIATEQ